MLDQRNSPKLLIGIATGLVALIVLVLAYQWFKSSLSKTAMPPEQAIAAQSTAANKTQANEVAIIPDPKTIQLVDEQIIKAEVPKNESLAKEEVAKLDDIQAQLNDQQEMLKEQHRNADDLIALKEEQIKLLEAQLKPAQ